MRLANKLLHRTGRELFHRYKAYKHADARIADLILETEAAWLKSEIQLSFLLDIKEELPTGLVNCFIECLSTIEIKLTTARNELEQFIARKDSILPVTTLSFSKKTRYSLFETHIQRTVAELAKWQAIFDPSWLFITRSPQTKIDQKLGTQVAPGKPGDKVLDDIKAIRAVIRELKPGKGSENASSIFIPADFVARNRTVLVESSTELSTLASDTNSLVLVDTTSYPEDTGGANVKRQVRDLARILTHSDPSTLGLLKCLGVIELQTGADLVKQFQLVFAVPQQMHQAGSLRERLRQQSPSLDDKVVFATALARGVASVHAAEFVHKTIRPETIITFRGEQDSTVAAYLVGFERFRSDQVSTSLRGDMVWYHNLYRHPDERYHIKHDIYSLGVCLLEIGLWRTLVVQKDPPQTDPLLSILDDIELSNKKQAALNVKAKLIVVACENLPALMGRSYTEVVMSCLTCLDTSQTNMFADDKDLIDEDGILVGVAFVRQVLTRLLSIRVSDS